MCNFCEKVDDRDFLISRDTPLFWNNSMCKTGIGTAVDISTSGELVLIADLDGTPFVDEKIKINYCPMCGRKL